MNQLRSSDTSNTTSRFTHHKMPNKHRWTHEWSKDSLRFNSKRLGQGRLYYNVLDQTGVNWFSAGNGTPVSRIKTEWRLCFVIYNVCRRHPFLSPLSQSRTLEIALQTGARAALTVPHVSVNRYLAGPAILSINSAQHTATQDITITKGTGSGALVANDTTVTYSSCCTPLLAQLLSINISQSQ